jgi:thermitase
MPSEQESNNEAVLLATKPISPAVATVAIALILSLASSALLQNVNRLKANYLSIINDQEIQLAGVIASKNKKPVVETEINNQAPKETNRIIVKYKDDAKLPPGLTIASERANLEKAQGLVKVLTINGINAEVYEVSEDYTAQEVVDRILSSKKDLIEYAEVDMLVPPTLIPNDPLYTSQWHHNNVQTATAWDEAQGEGVIVAVLDSGIDATHSDLVSNLVPGWNTWSNSSDTSETGTSHGTLVSGVIAAIINNTNGLAGVAPLAKHLPIRTTDSSGNAYYSTIASGIVYAADHGAQVANISYGPMCSYLSAVDSAKYMRNKGGVVVFSAGNTGADNNQGSNPYTTCVSATDPSDNRTGWSSFGSSIDVAAPGAGIYTTNNGGGYSAVSGTSFSSPLTAGIYALMFSANPQLTPNQADNILFSTADDLGEPGWDMYYGHGRVNAAKAVAAAKATIGTQDTIAPSVPTNLRTTSVTANSISLTWNASTDDNTGVAQYDLYENDTKVDSIGGTTYNRTGLTPNTTYTYTVKAVDGAGNTSTSSSPISVTTTDVAFGINNYSVSAKTTTGATISTTLTKPGTVTIKYGKTAGALTSTAQGTISGTSHTINLSGLTAATTYYYQVVATDASGTVVSSAVSSFKTNRSTGGGKKR